MKGQSTNPGLPAIAATLSSALHLRQPPVALCFCELLPTGVSLHSGRVPAGCRFWEDAASSTFATTAADHYRCAIGVYTHNLTPSPEQQTDLTEALRVFADLGYVRAEDLLHIPVLQSRPQYVIYSKLDHSPLVPDVVLLFVDASQILILTEAAQQLENQITPAMGRPACALVPQVMNSGRAALSLGCCGARAYLDILTEATAVFAIPGAQLATYAARIEALAGSNEILTQFHRARRRAVAVGHDPTVKESLEAMRF